MPTIEIDGLEELLRAIREFPEDARPIAEMAMNRTVDVVVKRLAVYPPTSEANAPGRVDTRGRAMGYYERSKGWWYPVKRGNVPRLKSEGGRLPKGRAEKALFQQLQVKGFKLRPTSDRMLESWGTRVDDTGEAIIGLIGNRASYKDYVVGAHQAAIHASRGWPRVDKVLEASAQDIEEIWNQAVSEAIRRFYEK